jgi:hypothetical protein
MMLEYRCGRQVSGTVGFIRQMETEFEHHLTLKLNVLVNPESPLSSSEEFVSWIFFNRTEPTGRSQSYVAWNLQEKSQSATIRII